MTATVIQDHTSRESGHKWAIGAFYLWVFVLLGRPQDLLPALVSLRPALLLSLFTLAVLLLTYPAVFSRLSLRNRQVRLFIYLFCLMILGIPFALYVRRSFTEVFAAYTPVVLFFLLFYAIAVWAKRIENLIFVGTCASGLYATFSLIAGNSDGRFSFGNMFDSNDLAYFAVSFLPFTFLFLSKRTGLLKRFVSLCTLLSCTFLILLSGSRGGFIAFIALMFILLFSRTRTITRFTKVLFVGVGVTLLVVGSFKIDLLRYRTLTNLTEDYNVQDEYGRLAIWQTGMKLMLSSPLTGVGVSCFGEAIGRDREVRHLRPTWQTAHSSFVQIGAETGIAGFLLFIMMSFNALRIFNSTRKSAVSEDMARIAEMSAAAFLGNLIAGAFLSQAYSLYWAFFIALSAVILQSRTEAGTKAQLSSHPPQYFRYAS